jgi:DNA-binding NarL/FixJ family response regulator
MLPPSKPLRLAVVNDFEVVVAGIAAMLSGHGRRIRVVELDNRLPVVADVDIVLTDTFAQVSGDGVGLAELVRRARLSEAKVVVFTWRATPESVQEALSQGAAGCLSKGLTAEELVEALEAIHAGQMGPCAGGSTLAPSDDAVGDWPGRGVGLTPGEAEVLTLIARASATRRSPMRSTSVNSVKTHIRTAYRKIGVCRRPQAVVWAIERGFVPVARRRIQAPQRIADEHSGY